jgi:hypothetical protein
VTTSVAFDVESLADTVTRTVIALLTLVAVVLVVLGLGRSWAGRRRAQIVIEDIERLEGLPGVAVAGLSPQLRQSVRRALASQARGASYSHQVTLMKDLASGQLVTMRGTRISAVTTELLSTTRDSLTALAAGMRAVVPKDADGLLAVLGASLPAQRGYVVRTFPALREAGGHTEVGLTLEFAEFGHAPDAVTTFWASTVTVGSEPELAAAARGALHELLEPASLWVAIRLVARHLTHTGRLDGRRLEFGRRRRAELGGLRLQLAGQMSLYATRKQERFDRGFADQALDDLAAAARLLPHYFRPHYMQAAVHERVGWSHLRAGSTGPARRAFIEAVQAYDRADDLLRAPDDRVAADAYGETHGLISVRRTKCRLLSDDTAQSVVARRELQTWTEPRQATTQVLYNAACLMAVASAGEGNEGGRPCRWERRAWHLLGRSVLVGGDEGPWERVVTDIELRTLDPTLRSKFCEELKARTADSAGIPDLEARALVEEVMCALDIGPPPVPDTPDPARLRG